MTTRAHLRAGRHMAHLPEQCQQRWRGPSVHAGSLPIRRRTCRHSGRRTPSAPERECARPGRRDSRSRDRRALLRRCTGSDDQPAVPRNRIHPEVWPARHPRTTVRPCSRACKPWRPSCRLRRHRAQASGRSHDGSAGRRPRVQGATCLTSACDSPPASNGPQWSGRPAQDAAYSPACPSAPEAAPPRSSRHLCDGCPCRSAASRVRASTRAMCGSSSSSRRRRRGDLCSACALPRHRCRNP